MAPPKQSSFLEGSMNDRVSAVPPADFLGEGSANCTDYEKQFAMDWKPPELQFGRDGGGGGYSNTPGNRSSFMSVRSGMSSFTMRTGAATSTKTTSRGLFGKVKDKLALHKSRSTWTVGEEGDDDAAEEEDDEGCGDGRNTGDNNSSSFLANFPIPPVFKHKRSESMDPATLRANQRGSKTTNGFASSTSELGLFQRSNNAAAANRPAPPPRADSLHTTLPSSFDPTKRPTRDEIAANYQSLLAGGFFGTHAIQSTRFSPPGAGAHRRRENVTDAPPPSFAQRLEAEAEGMDAEDGERILPPSPLRAPPPPPPPNREAPPPPPAPEVEMEVEEADESGASTPNGIPASATAVFNPLPPAQNSFSRDTTMSPPPLPKQRNPKPATHKPATSFSAIPYASTRPGNEPTQIQRPYRPPPVSLARFSVDSSSRPRGTKRPFSSETANDSQTSFYTDSRCSYDYDPMATDGHGGIGVATTTAPASPEKVESGARRFVKRLKKSASRLSFRSQGQFNGGENDHDGNEGGAEMQQPPSRPSMASNVRRSFSWKLGGLNKPESTTAPSNTAPSQPHAATNVTGNNNNTSTFGETFSLNNFSSANSSTDHFQFHTATAPSFPGTNVASPIPVGQGLPAITASPVSTPSHTPTAADRNQLKKREIRTRRLRRNKSGSPLKQDAAAAATMDWQTQGQHQSAPASPSKRPRRSGASILMRALDFSNKNHNNTDNHRNATPTNMTDDDEQESDEPEPPINIDLPSAAPSDTMEGVEFSFHLPGRTRLSAGAGHVATSSRSSSGNSSGDGYSLGGGGGGGMPLAVTQMPQHVHRGVPSMADTLGSFRASKTSGSVRVVRAD